MDEGIMRFHLYLLLIFYLKTRQSKRPQTTPRKNILSLSTHENQKIEYSISSPTPHHQRIKSIMPSNFSTITCDQPIESLRSSPLPPLNNQNQGMEERITITTHRQIPIRSSRLLHLPITSYLNCSRVITKKMGRGHLLNSRFLITYPVAVSDYIGMLPPSPPPPLSINTSRGHGNPQIDHSTLKLTNPFHSPINSVNLDRFGKDGFILRQGKKNLQLMAEKAISPVSFSVAVDSGKKERNRDRDREKQRERQRNKEKEKEKERERQRNKEKEKEKEKERERERERENRMEMIRHPITLLDHVNIDSSVAVAVAIDDHTGRNEENGIRENCFFFTTNNSSPEEWPCGKMDEGTLEKIKSGIGIKKRDPAIGNSNKEDGRYGFDQRHDRPENEIPGNTANESVVTKEEATLERERKDGKENKSIATEEETTKEKEIKFWKEKGEKGKKKRQTTNGEIATLKKKRLEKEKRRNQREFKKAIKKFKRRIRRRLKASQPISISDVIRYEVYHKNKGALTSAELLDYEKTIIIRDEKMKGGENMSN